VLCTEGRKCHLQNWGSESAASVVECLLAENKRKLIFRVRKQYIARSSLPTSCRNRPRWAEAKRWGGGRVVSLGEASLTEARPPIREYEETVGALLDPTRPEEASLNDTLHGQCPLQTAPPPQSDTSSHPGVPTGPPKLTSPYFFCEHFMKQNNVVQQS